ncbi:hypothetical protein Pan258_54520 [Symmachiella dynata]|uniref:hypothetical protein n=1 Tax=Symmachiella dynata TaxID=2527995 RepID=UPI00118A36A7|nr:hypothetical protein [Symmachiella dynata]QDT51363.1 hypothetical protein Pan258_54520 [Symmachiella dynata]
MVYSRLNVVFGVVFCGFLLGSSNVHAAPLWVDLSQAVVVSAGQGDETEDVAATILVEELAKRSGIQLKIQQTWPESDRPVIAIATRNTKADWSNRIPRRDDLRLPEAQSEGFAIRVVDAPNPKSPAVFIVGADSRGAIYGVGRLLRELHCRKGEIKLDKDLQIATAPEYPHRGHEMGYRALSNSYDAWSRAQYDQYIREQVLLGMNCVQNIPFQDGRTNELMQYPRPEMNRIIGEICDRYDVDYWVWTPVQFSLTDQKLRQAELKKHAQFYESTPRLDAVFVPGGDPGDNPPELVIPFMEDLAKLLAKSHPRAKVWVSLQDFDEPKIKFVMDYIAREQPDWLGGIVADTSALSIRETRMRLPKRYPVRSYPDITHTVECQFPVSWWDPAYAVTLVRESTNPRPVAYSTIFRRFAPHTDGFVTYSDGINDDVNKAVWSMLGWDSQQDAREILVQYAHFHFGAEAAESIADALLGLENNWQGSLAENAGVDGVLALWQRLEEQHPELLENWRFQQHLMRAYYDAYTRHRLLYETQLEQEALQTLAQAPKFGALTAMQRAERILQRVVSAPCRPELRARIDDLAEELFRSIGYQTSVERFGGSGAERGCVMDFVDRPLNDRWWLEAEFAKIRKISREQDRVARLDVIRTWEDPGPGSFYDDIGHVGKSPHVIRGEAINTDPEGRHAWNPGHTWVDEGRSRRRLSWLHHMRWPVGVDYDGLDPDARYIVRLTGQGESPLRGDGKKLPVTKRASQIGEFQEFAVPAELTADGALRLTWDPVDETHVPWQKRSHLAEVWLLKQ